jgi:GDP-L-fucose synthase
MEASARIFVAGSRGMVGSAIIRCLRRHGFGTILGPSSRELDLTDGSAVSRFFEAEKPEYVFLAAAKVGGILANDTYPADFIHTNLSIQDNVIHSAWRHGVKKLLFPGSPCIYPKLAAQPMVESALLTGPLEITSEPYAIAKIAGIRMCQAYNRQFGTRYITCMPTNLFGPNDNYHPVHSHVLPALIRKVHDAKVNGHPTFEIWGSGSPLREFLFVDDLAEACLLLMREYEGSDFVNIGGGQEVSVRELAGIIRKIVGYGGELVFDTGRPDGAPRKVLEGSKMKAMGWTPKMGLEEGIRLTYEDFLNNPVRK